MLRRDMLKTLGSLPLLSLAPSLAHAELLGQPWSRARDALIFDAMGELRDVYTDDLIQEMLDAGMRAIAITLCDPKVQADGLGVPYVKISIRLRGKTGMDSTIPFP